jgi:hypothetical protein
MDRFLLEGLVVDDRIILEWAIKKWVGARTGLNWLRIGTRDRHL